MLFLSGFRRQCIDSSTHGANSHSDARPRYARNRQRRGRGRRWYVAHVQAARALQQQRTLQQFSAAIDRLCAHAGATRSQVGALQCGQYLRTSRRQSSTHARGCAAPSHRRVNARATCPGSLETQRFRADRASRDDAAADRQKIVRRPPPLQEFAAAHCRPSGTSSASSSCRRSCNASSA